MHVRHVLFPLAATPRRALEPEFVAALWPTFWRRFSPLRIASVTLHVHRKDTGTPFFLDLWPICDIKVAVLCH